MINDLYHKIEKYLLMPGGKKRTFSKLPKWMTWHGFYKCHL